jgi:D-alanyl-D-alanine carboxypeptidase/D-alanyl-D-alanine-endopeptidase (penicillin-binding protein 4)
VSRFTHAGRGGTRSRGASDARTETGAALLGKIIGVVVVVALGLGVAGYVRSQSSGSGSPPAAGSGVTTLPGQPPASGPGLRLPSPATPAPVLTALDSSRAVDVSRLKARVAPLLRSPRLGHHVAFAVEALGARRLLWRSGGTAPVTPASTMKLLTMTTALDALRPGHRFTTSAVRGRDRHVVVLVGGGDPLLASRRSSAAQSTGDYPREATLQQLAARTARRLAREHVKTVKLGYDDSLFVGPAVNPHWEPTYVPESVVSPISALWVDEGRAAPGLLQRSADPARDAADLFAHLLESRGVEVRPSVAPVRAHRHAHVLAQVQSAPLAAIVQHVLEHSDNEGAEVLLRQLAIATGRPGSFAAGVKVVRKTLTRLGVPLRHAVLYDGSGLSRDDRVPVRTLLSVLQLDASESHPGLRPVVSGLPVAGFTGSLAYRFLYDAPGGLGLVRAKTGTLTGVHALAGIATTRSGKALVYAVVADDVPVPKTSLARIQLDRISSALATCRC